MKNKGFIILMCEKCDNFKKPIYEVESRIG